MGLGVRVGDKVRHDAVVHVHHVRLGLGARGYIISARLPDAVCARLRLLQLRRVPGELGEEHLIRVRVRVSVRVRVRDRVTLT